MTGGGIMTEGDMMEALVDVFERITEMMEQGAAVDLSIEWGVKPVSVDKGYVRWEFDGSGQVTITINGGPKKWGPEEIAKELNSNA